MAWTDLDPFKVEQLIDADALNAFRDNLEYLLAPNIAVYHHPGTGSDYTTTGTIGDDLDATNFNLSVTSYGGPIIATFVGIISGSTTAVSTRINIVKTDDLSYIGRNLYNNFAAEYQNTQQRSISIIKRFDDLPAGTHSFKVVWGVSTGTATMYVENRPRFCVVAW